MYPSLSRKSRNLTLVFGSFTTSGYIRVYSWKPGEHTEMVESGYTAGSLENIQKW